MRPGLWQRQTLTGKVFLALLAFAGSLTALALLVNAFAGSGGAEKLERGLGKGTLVEVSPGQSDLRFDPSELPKSRAERLEAAPAELLPDRWTSDPDEGLASDPAAVPASVRTELLEALNAFLAAWETFQPTGDDGDAYRSSLAPLVMPGSLDTVAERIDSRQPAGICPRATCTTGSVWRPQRPIALTARIRDYTGDSAYVTLEGAVLYLSAESDLDGREYVRSYALMLVKRSGVWLVERAAAETLAY